jgi:hypothetical protein
MTKENILILSYFSIDRTTAFAYIIGMDATRTLAAAIMVLAAMLAGNVAGYRAPRATSKPAAVAAVGS